MVEKELTTTLMTQEVLKPLKSVVEDETISEEIQRLQRRVIVQLEQMSSLHEWLNSKRLSRQACRVVGESRTGKSVACNAYRLLSPPVLKRGEPPQISVVYWQSSPESGPGDLFKGILDYLKYQLMRLKPYFGADDKICLKKRTTIREDHLINVLISDRRLVSCLI